MDKQDASDTGDASPDSKRTASQRRRASCKPGDYSGFFAIPGLPKDDVKDDPSFEPDTGTAKKTNRSSGSFSVPSPLSSQIIDDFMTKFIGMGGDYPLKGDPKTSNATPTTTGVFSGQQKLHESSSGDLVEPPMENTQHVPHLSPEAKARLKNLSPKLLVFADVDELWYQLTRTTGSRPTSEHVCYRVCRHSLLKLTEWYETRGSEKTWQDMPWKPPRPPSHAVLAGATALENKMDGMGMVERLGLSWYYFGTEPNDFWRGFNPGDRKHVDRKIPESRKLHCGRRLNTRTPDWFVAEVTRVQCEGLDNEQQLGTSTEHAIIQSGLSIPQSGVADQFRPGRSHSLPPFGDRGEPSAASITGLTRDHQTPRPNMPSQENVDGCLPKQLTTKDASGGNDTTQCNEVSEQDEEGGSDRSHGGLGVLSKDSETKEDTVEKQDKQVISSRMIRVKTPSGDTNTANAASSTPLNELHAPQKEETMDDSTMEQHADSKNGGSDQIVDGVKHILRMSGEEANHIRACIDEVELTEQKLATEGEHMGRWQDVLAAVRNEFTEKLEQHESGAVRQLSEKLQEVEEEQRAEAIRQAELQCQKDISLQPSSQVTPETVEELREAQRASNKRIREMEDQLKELRQETKKPRFFSRFFG